MHKRATRCRRAPRGRRRPGESAPTPSPRAPRFPAFRSCLIFYFRVRLIIVTPPRAFCPRLSGPNRECSERSRANNSRCCTYAACTINNNNNNNSALYYYTYACCYILCSEQKETWPRPFELRSRRPCFRCPGGGVVSIIFIFFCSLTGIIL